MGNGEKNKKKAIIMRWWVNKAFSPNPQGFDALPLSFTIEFFFYIFITQHKE